MTNVPPPLPPRHRRVLVTGRIRAASPQRALSDPTCQHVGGWRRPDPFSPEMLCAYCGLSSFEEDVQVAS